MARGRDLAGLAALAGLAYMANKKGKETTGVDPGAAMGAAMGADSSTSGMDAGDYGYGDAGAAVDAGAMADMGPRGSRAKVNPETGDLYYPEGAPARASARAASAAPTRVRPKATSREEGMKNYVPRRTPAANPDYGNEGRTYQAKEAAAPAAPASAKASAEPKTKLVRTVSGKFVRVPDGSSAEPDTEGGFLGKRMRAALGSNYKKGGKTKKMASGGMTASKRADGIASRGKTKCKMY